MDLTKDDVHICRVLFNKDTHAMAIALYGDRAREIYKYICYATLGSSDFFQYRIGSAFEKILYQDPIASFFFDNGLIDYSLFSNGDIYNLIMRSLIAEKIWDSGKLDAYLYKLEDYHIRWILSLSYIRDKIKKSGKLKLQNK